MAIPDNGRRRLTAIMSEQAKSTIGYLSNSWASCIYSNRSNAEITHSTLIFTAVAQNHGDS